jgi:hypothetical protein
MNAYPFPIVRSASGFFFLKPSGLWEEPAFVSNCRIGHFGGCSS